MTVTESKGTLVSIQIGLPQTYGTDDASDALDRRWTTGFYKQAVAGSVFVGRTNLDGDRQADLKVHGGIDKAVLAYSADHYEGWQAELGIPDLPYGAFGENLSISAITENDVNIGDLWRIGEVEFEVSQPRQPCWKLARRWRNNRLPKLVVQSGRSGWYFRVLREGMIRPGLEITLVERPHPTWSVTRANRALYEGVNRTELAGLSSLTELSRSWLADLS